ncbi:endonuclease domain-containing protein [Tsukamurella sp. PLM1]|uniref:endonuclease domain-containing protein n=1 Tax=Tsukamurella sp. PLM1 TaxID=2929795 RepID=UPI0020BF1952|nr:hypothetical protein [Tsukamurella sp. PLM1]
MLLYPRGVFCGWTAAALHGVAFCADKPIEIWLPEHKQRQGLIIRTGALPREDIIESGGLRYTTAVRGLIDIGRFAPGDEAIAGMDQCLRIGDDGRSATTRAAALEYLDAHRHLHRSRRVRAALAETDGRAESPPETHTRLLLHRDGLTMFVPQRIVARGRFRLDLGADEYRVAVEYDGRDHADPDQQSLDVARRNTLRHDYGWEVLPVTAAILASRGGDLLRQVRSALQERGWEAAA